MTPSRLQTARQIGTLMCQATRDILWASTEDWVQQKNPGAELALRVGSGQATYHRFDPRKKQHLITYGARMIAAKHQPATARGWLSTREIRDRRYFDGEVSVLNLLAHTCCHEFAHLLQHCAGERQFGSVHNRYFYEALDELHSDGAADATRSCLMTLASNYGIELSTAPFEFPAPAMEHHHWRVGDLVAFGDGRREKRGQVVRVNRRTCTVSVSQHARTLHYRVPLALLRQTTGDGSRQ